MPCDDGDDIVGCVACAKSVSVGCGWRDGKADSAWVDNGDIATPVVCIVGDVKVRGIGDCNIDGGEDESGGGEGKNGGSENDCGEPEGDSTFSGGKWKHK